MKKTKKHIWLAVIAIIIAALAFGYAYLTTTLSINGITDIDRNSWDIYFDNVQVTDGSVSGAQEIEAPTITSDTEVEFHVNLKKPGDFYEFTIEARNDGTIDAMINSVSKKLNGTEITTLPAYLSYTVTYADDLEIQENHLLAAESLETYKIRVEFKNDISASDLPSSAQSLTLSFDVEYIQADDNFKDVEHGIHVYTISSIKTYIGQSIPNGITQYSSAEEAMIAFENRPFYIKHMVRNGTIKESYIEFVVTPALVNANPGMTAGTYSVRGIQIEDEFGCKDEYYNSITDACVSPYFESNKEILLRAFGTSYCTDYINNFSCGVTGLDVSTSINADGYVTAGDIYCSIFFDGSSRCS